MAKLIVSDIHKSFGANAEVQVLTGVSFEADDSQTLAILGPSGSGKSTLLNILGSLERPDSGSVVCDGIVVEQLSGDALSAFRSQNVGFVFQEHHLLPQLSALENVMLPTLPFQPHFEPQSRAHQLLDKMGLAEKAADYPSTLSGGERQRVAVARALINSPGLILCDEPTGSLDTENGSAIINILLQLAAEDGVTVIMVTHNLEHASKFSRKLTLKDGRIV